MAKLLTRNDVAVVVAAISPYRAVRDEVRHEIGAFVEVFVRCPLDELIRRDVKGLYERALRGEVAQFTGVSDPYEEPANPEVVVDTDQESVESRWPGSWPRWSGSAISRPDAGPLVAHRRDASRDAVPPARDRS